jgi:hypothetical protein
MRPPFLSSTRLHSDSVQAIVTTIDASEESKAMDCTDLVDRMRGLAASPPDELSETQRRALLGAANQLVETLENPVEANFRFMFGVSLYHNARTTERLDDSDRLRLM